TVAHGAAAALGRPGRAGRRRGGRLVPAVVASPGVDERREAGGQCPLAVERYAQAQDALVAAGEVGERVDRDEGERAPLARGPGDVDRSRERAVRRRPLTEGEVGAREDEVR